MKLKFSADLGYQLDAIAAVVDLFKGQESFSSTCSFGLSGRQNGVLITEDAVGNNLEISEEKLLENLNEVQLRNCISPSPKEKLTAPYDFTVEMETGTGKTYVYLRTIFELNKIYGFSKFIIVVPSIAIKEGVWKSISIMSEHFRSLYDNVAFDPFVYDSSKPTRIRNFASSNSLQVMIINIDAFRKSFEGDKDKEAKANLIHRETEKLNGKNPYA